MRVTTPQGVTLRHHQHVVAQGGEETTAQRATVGGGLAIAGGAYRVPASLTKVVHRYPGKRGYREGRVYQGEQEPADRRVGRHTRTVFS